MKRLIFTAIAILCFSTVFSQQKDFQYHPWKEYQGKTPEDPLGDTLSFLSQFFYITQDDIKKETNFEWLFNILDKEMPVKSIRYVADEIKVHFVAFNLNNDIFDTENFRGGG